MLYQSTREAVQVYRKHSRSFVIAWSIRQGWPLYPLLYVPALEPLLQILRNEGANQTLRIVLLVGDHWANVSAYADDITVFVSRHSDIEAMKNAIMRYEQITGTKINFDKSEDLRLGAWKGGVSSSGPFHWSNGPTSTLGVEFGLGF